MKRIWKRWPGHVILLGAYLAAAATLLSITGWQT